MRLKAVHSIKHGGVEFAPGSVFEVGSKEQAGRLITLGAAIESGEPVTGGVTPEDLTETMPAPPPRAPAQGNGNGNGNQGRR